jgi:hypothetical protein
VDGLGEPLERVESTVPLPSELGHFAGGLVEAVGVDQVENLAALFAASDQPDLLEHEQVLGDGLAGEGDLPRQPTGTGISMTDQKVEDPATRRVGDSRPQLVVRFRRHPLRRTLSSLARRSKKSPQPSPCSRV